MLLNIYSATQWHVLWTRYIHPSWSSYLGGAGDWGKGVWMYSNGLFRSHSDESRKWARNSCQHSWWAPTAPGWYAQPLIFASIRFLKLWHFCHLPPESPAFWSTLQEHILSASSCQEDLAHLRHINWSSVETFEPFFLKKEKHLGTTEKKRWKKEIRSLKFCSAIWACARLAGTTCKFFLRSLKSAVTQLSVGCVSEVLLVWEKSRSPWIPPDSVQDVIVARGDDHTPPMT